MATLLAASATAPSLARAGATGELPSSVAGIAIPRTRLALAAAALSRRAGPEFLFNHCMRTYVFGALCARRDGAAFEPEPAFVAAALHDLGLLPAYESKGGSFEVDSADAAETFAVANGATASEAALIRSATIMHDMQLAAGSRQSPTVILVNAGAGCDVVGPDPHIITPPVVAEVLKAFPRRSFKQGFKGLISDHCHRKPTSQSGTWLGAYCSAVALNAGSNSVSQVIDAAPFSE